MAAPIRSFVQHGLGSPGLFLKCWQWLPGVSRQSWRCICTSLHLFSDSTNKESKTFDEKILDHLCCPLSKKPLRYDRDKNELVCDEIGVAYPIVNGIPNLIPQDARTLKNNKPLSTDSKPST